MNRLRKLAKWLWLNKERMVLVIMVGFLIQRIYIVIQPQTTEEIPITPPSKGLTEAALAELPKDPEPPPRTRLGQDVSPLWRDDPFLHIPRGQRGQAGGTEDRPAVKLLMFAPKGDSWRVRLQTDDKFWLDEGGEFEIYEVLEINQEEGYVRLEVSLEGGKKEIIRIEKE